MDVTDTAVVPAREYGCKIHIAIGIGHLVPPQVSKSGLPRIIAVVITGIQTVFITVPYIYPHILHRLTIIYAQDSEFYLERCTQLTFRYIAAKESGVCRKIQWKRACRFRWNQGTGSKGIAFISTAGKGFGKRQ
ncbi:hypothetical protein D9M68_768420 [compost metagenome]